MARWTIERAILEIDILKKRITDLTSTVSSLTASDIEVSPSGNLSSTDVQQALQELQGDIDTNTSSIDNLISPFLLMGA